NALVRKAIRRIYQEYAVRSCIMAEKTCLTAKLCRGLSWNCVDSRLRTIDASPSLSSLSPLRVRNCTRNHGVRDHLHTYRVIINIPTPYSRVSPSSSPSGAEAARELSDCSAYPLLRPSPLLSPPLRFGTFPGLDGRSGSEQAFFMDIIAAAVLPYVKHIRRDCTAHRLKC
ncbi:hypothetical protein ALC57_17021, partial [Trachymyrmex cornetzi]